MDVSQRVLRCKFNSWIDHKKLLKLFLTKKSGSRLGGQQNLNFRSCQGDGHLFLTCSYRTWAPWPLPWFTAGNTWLKLYYHNSINQSCLWNAMYLHWNTSIATNSVVGTKRKHSSRMQTARLLTIHTSHWTCLNISWGGGLYSEVQVDKFKHHGGARRGRARRRSMYSKVQCIMANGRMGPPPVNRQIHIYDWKDRYRHMTENITFPQLR